MTQEKKAAQRSSVALLSLSMAAMLAMPAAAATTYTVVNSARVGNAEQVEIIKVDDGTAKGKYYGLVVGGNTSEAKIRSLALDPVDNLIKSYDFTSIVSPSLGLDAPVAIDVDAHPTANYAAVLVADQQPAARAGSTSTKRGGVFFVQLAQDGGISRVPSSPLIRMNTVSTDPEAIAISPNGAFAVVANKAEGSGVSSTANTPGTISLIDLSGDNSPVGATVAADLVPTAVADSLNRRVADLAPEAVAVNGDSTRAFVTLGENNALAIVSIAEPLSASTVKTVSLPIAPGGTIRPFPEGIATFTGADGSDYIVTANRGFGSTSTTTRANSVSLYRVNADDTLTSIQDSGTAIAQEAARLGLPTNSISGSEPRFVTLGEFEGKLKAYVTLSASNAVAVFDVDPTLDSPEALSLETIVSLAPSTLPTGIDSALPFSDQALIVTANRTASSANVSVISAASDIAPAVAFAAETINVPENAGTFNLTVRLSGSTDEPVTVNYAVTGGNAIAGQDYNLANGSVTFAPGEVTKVVPVEIVDNTVSNNPRTIEVTLTAPTNATLAIPSKTTLNIIDNESASVGFVINALSVDEDAGVATVQLRRVGGEGQTVGVRVTSANGTAVAGQDFTAFDQVVSFGPTEMLKSIQVAITNDTAEEVAESFTLNLSEPIGSTQLVDSKVVTITINGNDVAVTPPAPAPQEILVFLPYVSR